eukprot:13177574-Alexandrium_andersonii.AAC.1
MAAEQWIKGVEALDGKINRKKTVALASCRGMHKELQRRLEPMGIGLVRGARDLGVDDTMARCRRTSTMAGRMKKVAARAGRLRMLARASRKAFGMQKSGLDAAATYGCAA